MNLKNIYQHSQNLSECLREIQTLLEEKAIAMSKLENETEVSKTVDKICQVDGAILLQEKQIEKIIKKLYHEQTTKRTHSTSN